MAELSLLIKADFEEASKQFKELADTSEATREKIEKYTEKFKSEEIERLIKAGLDPQSKAVKKPSA